MSILKSHVKRALEAINRIEAEQCYLLELLKRVSDEAVEHWPDAENWPIIKEIKDLLAEEL